MIIDFHAHAFPDELAKKAIPLLEEEGGVKACLDGRISSLIASMDGAGIDASIIASIATKPEQFRSILNWSQSIASDRIIPFPSVHPQDPKMLDHMGEIIAAGFRGIKLHPYYQGFCVDDESLYPLYQKLESSGSILLLHTGFDIAFERKRIADPIRTIKVLHRFPKLKLIATHIGAWQDWHEVERHILGKPIFIDTSYSLQFMNKGEAREILMTHPKDFLLYGSDSPWGDQRQSIEDVRQLELPEDRIGAVLGNNAQRLLDL